MLNEGMPMYRRQYEKGRLVTEFKVNFPENGFLFPDKLALLEKLLPERKEVEETDEMDQVEMVDFDPNQERRRHYNGEAMRMADLIPGAVFSVRPLSAARESHSLLAFHTQ